MTALGTTLLPALLVLLVLAAGFACAPTLVVARQPDTMSASSTPSRSSRLPGGAALVIAATTGATLSIALLGPLPTAALAVALWGRRRVATVLASRRQHRLRERDLPDAIELLVLTVQAGLTPRQATHDLASIAPPSLRPAFASVCHRLDRGESLADALDALRHDLGTSADPLIDALAGAERHGLPLAPVLERLAVEARATRRRLGEAAARRLPVVLSFPLVACTLPSFVLLAIAPSVLAALSSLGDSTW